MKVPAKKPFYLLVNSKIDRIEENNPIYWNYFRGTAEGSVCHCTTEKCNPGNRLKVEWLTTVLMPAIVLLSLLSAMLSFLYGRGVMM